MKKILLSLGTIVFVGSIAVAATGAFFNDTETSTGNTFAAGSLDLRVDSVAHINGLVCYDGAWASEEAVVWDAESEALVVDGDIDAANAAYNDANPANVPQAGDECGGTWALTDLGPSNTFFDFGDLKPGDEGENTVSIHVDNNDAYLCAAIHNVQDDDNTFTEPELDMDTSTSTPFGFGELGAALNFFVWEDDGDNIFDQDENVLVENASGTNIAGVFDLYTPGNGQVFQGGETQYLGVKWCYGTFNGNGTCNGSSVDNASQTDSLSADISFYVEQARNNGEFVCPALDQFERVDDQEGAA